MNEDRIWSELLVNSMSKFAVFFRHFIVCLVESRWHGGGLFKYLAKIDVMMEISCLVPIYSQFKDLLICQIYICRFKRPDNDMSTWYMVSTVKPERYGIYLVVAESCVRPTISIKFSANGAWDIWTEIDVVMCFPSEVDSNKVGDFNYEVY